MVNMKSDNKNKSAQQLIIFKFVVSWTVGYDLLKSKFWKQNITNSHHAYKFGHSSPARGFILFWRIYGFCVYKLFGQETVDKWNTE